MHKSGTTREGNRKKKHTQHIAMRANKTKFYFETKGQWGGSELHYFSHSLLTSINYKIRVKILQEYKKSFAIERKNQQQSNNNKFIIIQEM